MWLIFNRPTLTSSMKFWSPWLIVNILCIIPHLASLYWLPIDSRIQYKLSSLCYNCLNSTAPDYLTELLRIYKPTRQLRSSSDTSILCIPTVRTHSLGQRSFFYAAPTVWNTLPYESGHPTPSHPSNHHLKRIFFSSPTDCVCVCVWGGERGEGERGREREN